MAITTLLAVHSADETIGSVKPILSLAGKMGAHLNLVVFGALKTVPATSYPGLPDDYFAEEHERTVKQTHARAESVKALIQEEYVSASILVECIDRGMIGRTMSRHALYADITIFPNQSVPENELMTDAFNGILFDSGMPVLTLGAEDAPLPEPKRILMAWNGEPEAAKAFHHSLPLLDAAEDIHVVIVDPTGYAPRANPGDDMAAFITRHGRKVTVDTLASAGREVADVLLQHALDKDADLIVMGAYGHTRLREWLLGGTTREMLSKSRLPVLMAH
ncbi:universal stress protein [Hoeflea sp. TYP-13]|uniref:universal stress protein n=1 Tax=Hoeflea sp. TYP-13 TaxID=3230023 RepID=UPI0034C6B5D4